MTDKRHPTYLLMNGELVLYDDARVHVLSTAFKYGATVFEGLRAYWNAEQGELYGFRLREHFQRLVESLRICRMGSPLTVEEYTADLLKLIRANGLREDQHMRVSAFVEADDGGLGSSGPISVSMAALPMGRYFAKEGLDIQVSSWTRISDTSMPPRVKAVPNYHNSRLALLQARADGYDDALLLTGEGKVTEGPGYALFMVRGGRLITPPVTSGILESITRDAVLTLAEDAGLRIEERLIDRTELYIADELFFCGSAAEVTPVFSVDRITVGSGSTGPTTATLRQAFLATVRAERADTHGWLTPIFAAEAAAVAASTAVSAT
ncbi:MAG: branched-chain amino acid transaminase [Chloroflexi bacterium]|nr:branched-chain amino acid transaminase [Chloroflexota bacterium]